MKQINLSSIQNNLLNLLAKRNGFINHNKSGIKIDEHELWHNIDSTYEVEICFICGKEISNCFNHENDIYEHGIKHLENSKLKMFL